MAPGPRRESLETAGERAGLPAGGAGRARLRRLGAMRWRALGRRHRPGACEEVPAETARGGALAGALPQDSREARVHWIDGEEGLSVAMEHQVVPERLIGGAGQRQVSLPLTKAVEMAFQSIRVRFWRSMITAGGVLLGIAFLSSTFGQSILAEHAVVSRAAVDETARRIQEQEAHARQIWLVVMSLIVCTVGIANSMLMSVTERFKEIGTMKCLGAMDGFIVKLFLLEAGFLGMVASVLGWIVGYGTTVLISFIRDGSKL